MYIFLSKIREMDYHCGYQSVCERRNAHYLYSNVNAYSNLLYIAPAEQTPPPQRAEKSTEERTVEEYNAGKHNLDKQKVVCGLYGQRAS